MSPITITSLRIFVESLHLKSDQKLYDALANTVIETGGVWLLPNPNSAKNYHGICEIKLFEIAGIGRDPSETVTDWVKTANHFLKEMDAEAVHA